MNILYLSCHGILEFDEVKILTELGHNVFCLGDVGGNERPLIYGRDKCNWLDNNEIQEMRKRGQGNLPDFAIDKCDAIICMHVSGWLFNQWDRIKHKKCYLRLIGQHSHGRGAQLRPLTDTGLKAIPYWESDATIEGLSPDQLTNVVHFYKDESEFSGWTGERKMIMTVCNDIQRGGGNACHASEYKIATDSLPRILVGKKNQLFGDYTARVPYWMLKDLYKQCKLYFYLGTEPATYTLNLIEAMMTGMPIVAYQGSSYSAVKEVVKNYSNDPDELYDRLSDLIEKPLGELNELTCRETAIKLFGKTQALEAWKKALE